MADTLTHYRRLLGIAASWAIKHLPGWDDEFHRQLLARHGAKEVNGRVSATTMGLVGLKAALADYEHRGWKKTAKRDGKAVPRDIAMIVGKWGKLGQAGEVQHASRDALLVWCGGQVGRSLKSLDELTKDERRKIIEALKSWDKRATA